jgi:hypothetical protein
MLDTHQDPEATIKLTARVEADDPRRLGLAIDTMRVRMAHKLRVRAVVVAVVVVVLSALAGVAGATTGTTPLAKPPRFRVTKAQVAPYLGRFVLAKQRSSRQLVSAAYVGGHNDRGYVEGGLAVYAYGPGGREVSWVGRTYEYHHTGDGMKIDVISADNEEIFARLKLRATSGGRLTGTLRELLPVPKKPVAITLRPAPK